MKIDALEKYILTYGDDRKDKVHKWHQDHLPLMLKAAGSSGNHQNWPGGYYDHIMECFRIAHRMWHAFEHRRMSFTLWQVFISLYFHDVEKLWMYTEGLPEGWNKDTYFTSLPDKYGFGLTVKERYAIRYIHGENEDYCKDKRVMSRLGAFCHATDVLSARLWFDRPQQKNYTPFIGGNTVGERNDSQLPGVCGEG